MVRINEGLDCALESAGENFCNGLHDAVLKGDGAEVARRGGRVSFWEKNEEGTVDAGEIDGVVVEVSEHAFNVVADKSPAYK